MVKTWTSADSDDFTCRHCGSVYSVKIHRLPVKDVDSANCEVCGQVLQSWNNTRVPVFKLKSKGKSHGEGAA